MHAHVNKQHGKLC